MAKRTRASAIEDLTPEKMPWVTAYKVLVKFNIIVFVLISAGVAFLFEEALPLSEDSFFRFGNMLLGLYFVTAASFILNQIQEIKIDAQMPRTQGRPLVIGKISRFQAWTLFIFHMIMGFSVLGLTQVKEVVLFSFITIILYNLFYTLLWKRKMAFGAIPGALPGAMPILIGHFSALGALESPKLWFLFLILFLWQMPHFWCLAIRYKDDYSKGAIPVLPAVIGVPKTMFHSFMYLFAYLGVILIAPWWLGLGWVYFLIALVTVVILLWTAFKYWKSFVANEVEQKGWLPFFLGINFSLLLVYAATLADRYYLFLFN